jgi:hypothetical protein
MESILLEMFMSLNVAKLGLVSGLDRLLWRLFVDGQLALSAAGSRSRSHDGRSSIANQLLNVSGLIGDRTLAHSIKVEYKARRLQLFGKRRVSSKRAGFVSTIASSGR